MCTRRGVGQIAGMVGPLTKLSLYFHNSQRGKSPFETTVSATKVLSQIGSSLKGPPPKKPLFFINFINCPPSSVFIIKSNSMLPKGFRNRPNLQYKFL